MSLCLNQNEGTVRQPDGAAGQRGSDPPVVTDGGRRPLITEIQRFSLQDGPGIRTTIFVKGCPLRCPWCHNPETQEASKEFYYYKSRCVSCGRCVEVCPSGASCLVKQADGRFTMELDRSLCQRCMRCVAVCLTDARAIAGQQMSIDDILREVLSDQPFYQNSGGGVTISGGDPLMYPKFVLELAQRLKAADVHVAIETSCFPKRWKIIAPLLPYIDLFIVDMKSLDPVKHEKVIGWPLKPIISNIQKLIESSANVRIHIPVVPGFNDSQNDFEMYKAFLGAYADRLNGVDILNYHAYGEGKYDALGRGEHYAYKGVEENPGDVVVPLAKGLRELGIRSVTVGGLVGITAVRDKSE